MISMKSHIIDEKGKKSQRVATYGIKYLMQSKGEG